MVSSVVFSPSGTGCSVLCPSNIDLSKEVCLRHLELGIPTPLAVSGCVPI